MLEDARASDIPWIRQNEAAIVVKSTKCCAFFGGCDSHRDLLDSCVRNDWLPAHNVASDVDEQARTTIDLLF